MPGWWAFLSGGSKHKIYELTAAYIPTIFGVMVTFGGDGSQVLAEKYSDGYGVLVLSSFCVGLLEFCLGVYRTAKFVARVPNSIVVGFTIGFPLTIALTQIGNVLGIKAKLPYPPIDKIPVMTQNTGKFNIFAAVLAAETFLITKYLLRISFYIPGPLIALGLGYAASETILKSQGLTAVKNKYPYWKHWRFIYPSTRQLAL